MTETYPFRPNWVLAPSETLRDWLSENGMSPSVLAVSCALACTHEVPHPPPGTRSCREARKQAVLTLITDVLERKPLTELHAARLARGTFIPARFWLALEHNYRAGLTAGLTDASEDPVSRCNRCAAPASCSEFGRCVLENGESAAREGAADG